MTVTAVRKDLEALTFTLEAEFDATPERIWQLWSDPRQLERWWGPPTYPATVTHHDLRPGGRVEYHMTGPEGDRHGGFWDILDVDPPRSLLLRDGFADTEGKPVGDLPVSTMHVTITEIGDGRTRMSNHATFPDLASLQQVIDMGMEEGAREAAGQIDALLAADAVVSTTG